MLYLPESFLCLKNNDVAKNVKLKYFTNCNVTYVPYKLETNSYNNPLEFHSNFTVIKFSGYQDSDCNP